VACHALPPGPRKAFYRLKRNWCPLTRIFEKAGSLVPGHLLCGYIMWGDDLLMQQVAEGRSGAPWATVGSASFSGRGHQCRAARREGELQVFCENHPDCAALLTVDYQVIASGLGKALPLPPQEEMDLPVDMASNPIVSAIGRHGAGRFCVGAFGILTGPRCLNELLRLAQLHPQTGLSWPGSFGRNRSRRICGRC